MASFSSVNQLQYYSAPSVGSFPPDFPAVLKVGSSSQGVGKSQVYLLDFSCLINSQSCLDCKSGPVARFSLIIIDDAWRVFYNRAIYELEN